MNLSLNNSEIFFQIIIKNVHFFLITSFIVNLYSLVSSINLVITFNKSYK